MLGSLGSWFVVQECETMLQDQNVGCAVVPEGRTGIRWVLAFLLAWCVLPGAAGIAQQADVVLHGGRIVTVDPQFRIVEALAIQGERILATGSDAAILELAGPATERVDLAGKTVLPGLIDTHSHPVSASMFEFDHQVPDMQTVADVLDYIRVRAAELDEGTWITVNQVFITRLRERRFPTRRELDQAAPRHPVMFRTGPDASLNSLALELSGIGEDFEITDGQPGFLERDPATGQLTGILRSCTRLVRVKSSGRTATDEDRYQRLRDLLAAYNEVGITSVVDRGVSDGSIALYQRLRERGELTCRMFLTYNVNAQGTLEEIEAKVRRAAEHPLRQYNNQLWLRGIKIFLDGGMLTGSAYMRQPWGVSEIYSITDPEYRGVLFIEPEKLYQIARLTLENDMQLTAHCVGDGAVETLVDAYERVNERFPVREKRPAISHANFMTARAIDKMAELGVVADLQPAWLWHDGATLLANFGDERLAYFQPYKRLFERGVIVGGGSDHMQKIGRRRSINTYDPFLGMWATLVRQPRWSDQPLHPEQAITRQQAIQLYTIQAAYLTFEEHEKGSLEPGKLADLIVLDRDILTCPAEQVKDTRVLATWLGGRVVYSGSGT
jgi:predicted amidohydrolase YtcJ